MTYWSVAAKVVQIQSNLTLYSQYYAEACNEFAGPISAPLRLWATQLLSKKCRSGGEPLATAKEVDLIFG